MDRHKNHECTQKRDVEIPDCKEQNPDDCHRSFHLYLPSIICDRSNRRELQSSNDAPGITSSGSIIEEEDASHHPPSQSIEAIIGTLPLIFAIHCFGCTTASIAPTFASHANSHNAVLVLPQGIQNSFNARHCCGYALANEVDDVGFLRYIQLQLSEEYEFVDREYSYGVGWSNGGFMVTHSASLFRSISPISGHIYDIDPDLKKSGTFCVDGICVNAPGNGKGMFLHHGLDDPLVKPTGCCDNPDLPKCCCGIEVETCLPIMEVARNWATEVNGCELAEEKEKEEPADTKNDQGLDDEEGGIAAGGKKESEETKDTDNLSDIAKFITTYSNPDEGIACQTAIGKGCKANTTLCLHEHSGHFNSPSFTKAFPFGKEVINFFARDACEVNGGTWNETSLECGACPEKYGGRYCLDDAKTIEKNIEKNAAIISIHPVEDSYEYEMGMISESSSSLSTSTSSETTQRMAKGYFLFAIAVLGYAIRHRYSRRGKKKDDRYFSNDVREEEAEEVAELVPSRGFHSS